MLDLNPLVTLVTETLDDIKAQDITVIDVTKLTDITARMVICTGNSARHVKSIANRLVKTAKDHKHRPLGIEGDMEGEWVLVDLDDVVVHIMQPKVREFYSLEKLWAHPPGIICE